MSLRLKPAVPKNLLLFMSGTMWICVGVMLNTFAYHWLKDYGFDHSTLFIISGFIAALIIHHFGFLRVVDKNLGRISSMEGRPCAFSFMSWKSYPIVS